MKTLSVIVPSYNSEAYLTSCIESLLESGKGIEIIIINDGSTDGTKNIADGYVKKYPDRIKAIHQKNSGHGGAINTGIASATGAYLKVVDSDDWVNPKALRRVVSHLQHFVESNQQVDMVISNFVYDKVGAMNKKIMHYRDIMPEHKVFTWNEIGRFKVGKYILMHSVIYRLEVLKACGLRMPEHTFYVDNLFVYQPLLHVKTMFYIDECLYHYYIGREDQSVNEKVMIERINQQLLVNNMMLTSVRLRTIKEPKKRQYMLHYLTIITTISSVLLLKSGTKESIMKKQVLWQTIKAEDFLLYIRMRISLLGGIINLPGIIGRKVTLFVYKKVQQKVGFN